MKFMVDSNNEKNDFPETAFNNFFSTLFLFYKQTLQHYSNSKKGPSGGPVLNTHLIIS